jgi:hypothetical protein
MIEGFLNVYRSGFLRVSKIDSLYQIIINITNNLVFETPIFDDVLFHVKRVMIY